MNKKRSNGVTVLAVLVILSSVMGLLTFARSAELISKGAFYLYLIIYPASIVAAIFLFKLNDRARAALIVISVIVGCHTIFTLPSVIKKVEEQDFSQLTAAMSDEYEAAVDQAIKAEIDKRGVEVSDEQIDLMKVEMKDRAEIVSKNLAKTGTIAASIISIVFNGIMIYFFTLPAVRRQFLA